MYNRYMRNDDGTYTRVPEEEPGRRPGQPPSGGQDRQEGRGNSFGQDHHGQGRREDYSPDQRDHSSGQDHGGDPPHGGQDRRTGGPGPGGPDPWERDGPFYGPPPPPSGGRKDGLTGFLRHFLDQWHLDSVDTGDLLLLGLLFFLFREDADEELLVALGLLLIL